jgi:hypothetical protein
MRYVKHLGIIASVIFVFLSGFATMPAEAQYRGRVIRRVVVRPLVYRDPFWYNSWYGPYYDPFYMTRYESPREMYEREKYKRESKVDEELRELNKAKEKAMRDGVVTAKESEKIMEERREYEKARADLESFRRSYSEYRS